MSSRERPPWTRARRELLEETGITAALACFVGLYEVIRHDPSGALAVHYVIACYTGLAMRA